jgi:hypothetical protein
MTREQVIFGVALDRETDSTIKKLAAMERRSKRNFHAVLMGRVARMWRENPEDLRKLRLIRDDQCPT